MKVAELFEGKRPGLWDNIHAKQKRIKAGSGKQMRKPGSKGAPSRKDFDNSRADEGKVGSAAQPKLFEGYGDWAILPATMALYGRRTVDIITAASTWEDEVILVCKNEQNRTCFVGSTGGESSFEYYKNDIGKSFSAFHDQTGASKGRYTVKNVVRIKKGEIVDQVNDVGIKEKASLSVFK